MNSLWWIEYKHPIAVEVLKDFEAKLALQLFMRRSRERRRERVVVQWIRDPNIKRNLIKWVPGHLRDRMQFSLHIPASDNQELPWLQFRLPYLLASDPLDWISKYIKNNNKMLVDYPYNIPILWLKVTVFRYSTERETILGTLITQEALCDQIIDREYSSNKVYLANSNVASFHRYFRSAAAPASGKMALTL